MPLQICFAASEVAPFAKTGGLADVAGALPSSLHRQGHDVRVFMPLYSSIDARYRDLKNVDGVQNVTVQLGVHSVSFSLREGVLPGTSLPMYFVHCPPMFGRSAIYSRDPDEHLRFLLFQRAILESCQRLRFAPQILHCNDWHLGMLPLMLKTTYAWDQLFAGTRSLLSIHNIGYQGIFPSGTLNDLGIAEPLRYLHRADLAAGRINWLYEGIVHADTVSTVSPTYAQEICTPAGGHGLDTALRERVAAGQEVVGILNGVDYRVWNPAVDHYLRERYEPEHLAGKALCKAELLKGRHLTAGLDTPLIGLVSRLALQKGIDLLFDSLPEVLGSRDVALVVLGSGEEHFEHFFTDLQARFPGRVSFTRGYNEALAHLIEAGADMFLMPSLYEPCGLNQMYSLKYGTIPIVRRTGGLADSVQMWDGASGEGTGVVFNDYDVPAVVWALNTALDLFQDSANWRRMMLNAMNKDYSWDHQAHEYVALYERMIG